MSDEIIRELWRVKDDIAKEFNYDIDTLGAELMRRQKESGRKLVNLSHRNVRPRSQMNPRVKEVTPEDDYRLRVTFTNGETGIYDCRHLLDFGVFKELRDVTYFRRVRVENNTVAWPHEQDIAPETIYLASVKLTPVAAGSGLNDAN